MNLIAGTVDLDAVMDRLRVERPVFHSEADFQHAFGQVLHDLGPGLKIRLEVRQENAEYLDLLAYGANGRTAIEFKYVTAAWSGTDAQTGETFRLRSHAADDLARRNVVFDIERLERFRAAGGDGLAIILTNVPALWTVPTSDRISRDHDFRIHDGRTLTGTLRWGGGDYPANERTLAGNYPLSWRKYSSLEGKNSIFRWLMIPVAHAA